MRELIRAARAATMNGPVIEDAAVIHDGGTILAVGAFSELGRDFDGPVRDLGDATLAPAVVNAHTHLELCHLHGRTREGHGFETWVEHLLSLPLYEPDDGRISAELEALKSLGVGLVADISTRNAAKMAGILEDSGLFFVSFHEAIGDDPPPAPAGPRGRGLESLAGHSLYTTQAHVLRAAREAARKRGLPFSLHLAEHEEEDAVVRGLPHSFADRLRARGRLRGFTPPGVSPVAHAASLGLLEPGTLAVHCARLDKEDIRILAASGSTVCLCPRSNAYIGSGRAPWEDLFRAGVPLCFGTDSLASNRDLNPWNEARYLLARFREELTLTDLLAMLTLNPARVLGMEASLGSLEPGKAARFSVVPSDIETLAGPLTRREKGV
ncbi:amidohydrolase family protein [Desulfovibrio aminophilus]|nr:amidohydrolase family protein [Desulfovibrio aminophilus]